MTKKQKQEIKRLDDAMVTLHYEISHGEEAEQDKKAIELMGKILDDLFDLREIIDGRGHESED